MKEIRTEVLIQASPTKVWDHFMDFSRHAAWDPFIHFIQGEIAVGQTIKIKLTPPDAGAMIFKPKIVKLEPNREFSWLGHLFFPGLFDGRHIFEFIDHKNGTTTFIQREQFTGILVPLFKKMLDDNTKRGFELLNNKLKEKCERS